MRISKYKVTLNNGKTIIVESLEVRKKGIYYVHGTLTVYIKNNMYKSAERIKY